MADADLPVCCSLTGECLYCLPSSSPREHHFQTAAHQFHSEPSSDVACMPVQIIADYAAGETQPRRASPLSASMHAPVSAAQSAPLTGPTALHAPSGVPCGLACKLTASVSHCPGVQQTLHSDAAVLHGRRRYICILSAGVLRSADVSQVQPARKALNIELAHLGLS